ncbi:MAG: FxsA family protein [Thermodesulfobacteriota bacterium]
MFARLVLLFTVIPALELYLLVEIGSRIGTLNTVLLIVATGVVGAHYARLQGFEVVRRLQESLGQGRAPAGEILDGAMLLLGGALLLTPGVLTDAVGFSLLFPPTRAAWKRVFARWLRRRIERGEIVVRRW